MQRLILVLAAALAAAPLAAPAQMRVTTVDTVEGQQALLKSPDPVAARNKKLVFDFWREVFQAGDMTKADQYMDENYIQHNPAVATGRAAFKAFFSGRGGAARPVSPTINNLVTISGDGDIVVLAFRREMPDPRNPGQTYTTTWFDMFRIVNGKVGEHWDYGTISAPGAGRGGPPAAAPARAN